jgi:ribose 5-phosphate isomerase B
MRIAVGADHAGYSLKEDIKVHLEQWGHDVEDYGTDSEEDTDYPPICASVARAVRDGRVERGVVVGGSGQGEQMTANKVRGVRAALCLDLYTARMARTHNDANVLSLGARIVAPEMARLILEIWLQTEFEGGRHERRIGQIMDIEREETAG